MRITDTTRSRILDAVTAGQAEGEGIAAIAKRIERTTGGVIARARGLVIARTEVHSASQAAHAEALTALDVPDVRNEWVAAADLRTRDSHRIADGQIREQGKPFDVGAAKLMHPGDPTGPPEEIIQCRCVAAAVVGEEPSTPQQPAGRDIEWSAAKTEDEAVRFATERLGFTKVVTDPRLDVKPFAKPARSSAARLQILNVANEEITRIANMSGRGREIGRNIVLIPSGVQRGRAYTNRAGAIGTNRTVVLQTAGKQNAADQRVVISWNRKNGRRWGAYDPSKENVQRHTVRHELGHNLTSRRLFDDFHRLARENDANSSNWWKKNVSEYAGTNAKEAIAESFALATAPYYRRGTLPQWLEQFLERVLKEG